MWSEGLKREAVWLSGVAASYELAAEVLERIGQVSILRSSIWRCVQEAGEQFRRVEEAECERAMMLPERWEPPSRAEVTDQRMGAGLDGLLIHLREEGWKEVKIGTVFEVEPTRSHRNGWKRPMPPTTAMSLIWVEPRSWAR